MSRTEAFVAALPYGLVIAGLAAIKLGVGQGAWAVIAGCALVNPQALGQPAGRGGPER